MNEELPQHKTKCYEVLFVICPECDKAFESVWTEADTGEICECSLCGYKWVVSECRLLQ